MLYVVNYINYINESRDLHTVYTGYSTVYVSTCIQRLGIDCFWSEDVGRRGGRGRGGERESERRGRDGWGRTGRGGRLRNYNRRACAKSSADWLSCRS